MERERKKPRSSGGKRERAGCVENVCPVLALIDALCPSCAHTLDLPVSRAMFVCVSVCVCVTDIVRRNPSSQRHIAESGHYIVQEPRESLVV